MCASPVRLAGEMIANSFRGAYHTKMRGRWGWGRNDALGFFKAHLYSCHGGEERTEKEKAATLA